jgi:acyl-CoA-dependent ceramide synthase
MEYILDPLARFRGIKSRKGLVRFKEQAWLALYASCSWFTGMVRIGCAKLHSEGENPQLTPPQYIAYHSDFWLNLNGMWEGWPFREVYGLWKCFYLVEFAFYLQQIIVVNIEEKRKDYAQMFVHHIFTCALIFLSYGYYHIRVGTVILCLMDLIDVVLPVSYHFHPFEDISLTTAGRKATEVHGTQHRL